MSGHTKGEWLVDGMQIYVGKHPNRLWIATLHVGLPRQEETEANARLIVAAPKLLAACEYTIEKLRGVKGKAFPIIPIITAIAAAKGD